MKTKYIDPISIVAKNIIKHRKKNNISQEELASLAGLHRTYIGMVERCKKNITILSLYKLAKALNVSLEELVKNHG